MWILFRFFSFVVHTSYYLVILIALFVLTDYVACPQASKTLSHIRASFSRTTRCINLKSLLTILFMIFDFSWSLMINAWKFLYPFFWLVDKWPWVTGIDINSNRPINLVLNFKRSSLILCRLKQMSCKCIIIDLTTTQRN